MEPGSGVKANSGNCGMMKVTLIESIVNDAFAGFMTTETVSLQFK